MSETVLVTGATGQQGGAVARALLAAGTPVRGLVRDPGSERARALAELGVEIVQGDLDDPESLKRALSGARALFSVQLPDLGDPVGDAEIRQARNLAAAAVAAGVDQVVHTSASGVTRMFRSPSSRSPTSPPRPRRPSPIRFASTVSNWTWRANDAVSGR